MTLERVLRRFIQQQQRFKEFVHEHECFESQLSDKCETAASCRHNDQTKKGSVMNNDLTNVNNRGTALAPQVSPWREAVNDEIGASFGTFLKFGKGEWLLGEEGKPVPAQSRFVANLEEYYRGWVRWWDGRPTDHQIGRVIDRHQVPMRETLGDLDESKWETEANGARRDPWAKTVYLAMREAGNDEIICFTSSSDGCRKAVAKLADRFDRVRHRHKAKMPVVTLEAESYQHQTYGKIWKPAFRIVDWAYRDDETAADPEAALQAQRDAEMNDAIPFG